MIRQLPVCEFLIAGIRTGVNARSRWLVWPLVAVMMLAPRAAAQQKPASRPPNVVIVVADDMGFSDLGCYGGEIQTPNLDRLAGEGLRFTQFYSTARCWPSRACILTGYYAQQVRRDALPGVPSGANGTRPSWARLLPQLLQPFGYRSYHSGKWHVDGPVLAGGFTHSYLLNDHNRHFCPQEHCWDDRPLPPVKPSDGYYTTTAIAQHAVEMLTEHHALFRDQPFFLYLAFTAPHFPLHALPEDIAVYRDVYGVGWDQVRRERFARLRKLGIVQGRLPELESSIVPSWNLAADKLRDLIGPGESARAIPWAQLTSDQKSFQAAKMAVHAAMVHRLDIEVGRIVQQLKAMGAYDNTLIFFLSDNGASAEQIIRGDSHDPTAEPGSAKSFLCLGPGWSSAANTPFRLHKSWVHEGGIASPLIVHWPQGIAARGALRRTPSHLIDLAPTILEIAGGSWPLFLDSLPVPPPPGKSLGPALLRDRAIKRDYLWWYHDDNRALRVGDWKLVADHQAPWELYYLRRDRSETRNLANSHPDKVRELEAAWNQHRDEFLQMAR
jgi:arylsulfatase A-like enzyme